MQNDTLTKVAAWAGLLLAVVLTFIVLFGSHGLGGSVIEPLQTDFQNGLKVAGSLVFDGTSGSPTLTLGTDGTELASIHTGTGTIWAPANTIAASTTQQVELQSATNGALTAGLTGITADSTCFVTQASTTPGATAIGGLVVTGVSASTTATADAGSIVVKILNLTGTTFTWGSTASSSPYWKYTCLDPA